MSAPSRFCLADRVCGVLWSDISGVGGALP